MQRGDGRIRQQVRLECIFHNVHVSAYPFLMRDGDPHFLFVFVLFLGFVNAETKTVKITYNEADGSSKTVDAEIGQNLMDVAHANDIELEGTYVLHLLYD